MDALAYLIETAEQNERNAEEFDQLSAHLEGLMTSGGLPNSTAWKALRWLYDAAEARNERAAEILVIALWDDALGRGYEKQEWNRLRELVEARFRQMKILRLVTERAKTGEVEE